jgi:glycosyltransferase involved in cell wall biosynthesis
MRVLFFYPANARSVALETMMLGLRSKGVEIELLTMCEAGALHEHLRLHGIPAHAFTAPRRPAIAFYLRHALNLIRLCRRRRIDVVFSHLQQANMIAVLARPFLGARLLPFRHHFTFVFPGEGVPVERNRSEDLFDWLIHRLSRTVIVPSADVAEGIHRIEGVDPRRLKVVPYIYDFSGYPTPDMAAVDDIRASFSATLTLIMVSRLVPLKRPDVAFEAVHDLIRDGLDIRLLVLGDGPLRGSLEAFVSARDLEARIVMLGQRRDVVDYMAAADLMIHPSLTEASCNAVKEMALLGKTAVVCAGVGDFNDYVHDGVNGFVMSRPGSVDEMAKIIREVYFSPERLGAMGAALHDAVLQRFGVSDVRVADYLELLS